ncbi:MAG: ABC transporter permease [Planctomycetes bacterium]|nr:ABC transporter permease [Planctomycetota bacterium]
MERVLPPLALFSLVVLLWYLATEVIWDRPYRLIPGPGQVARAAAENAGRLASAAGLTAAAALCGFALSLTAGCLVAFGFSQSRILQRSFYPYAVFLQTVPIVAVAPLIVFWFDYGFQSVVVVSFILSLFPIITNAATGLTAVDANLLELFELYNASRWQVLWKLRLPHAVPYLVAGARISSGLAVIGAIVGEISAGYGSERFGLGYIIFQTSGQLKTEELFAAVLASALLGFGIFAAVSRIGEALAGRWQSY